MLVLNDQIAAPKKYFSSSILEYLESIDMPNASIAQLFLFCHNLVARCIKEHSAIDNVFAD